MALPTLRHYKVSITGATVWTDVTPLVPAGRALVVSKLVVSPNGSGTGTRTFDVCIDSTVSEAGKIANSVSLAQGEVFTESGLVVLAGERVYAYLYSGSGIAGVQVFGEEVDN